MSATMIRVPASDFDHGELKRTPQKDNHDANTATAENRE